MEEIPCPSCALQEPTTLLSWQEPPDYGSYTVRFDTLRSRRPDDFFGLTTCLETEHGDTETLDATIPAPSRLNYYLIRVRNGCTNGGLLGPDSDGVERSAIVCP